MGHCVLVDVSYYCKCQCDGKDSKAGHSSIIEVNHCTTRMTEEVKKQVWLQLPFMAELELTL